MTPQAATLIAEKIWKNECNGSVAGLTHWNKGENFPSMGIGHFIWFGEKANEHFEEAFPLLLLFLKEHGTALPPWLEGVKGCPWKSRDDFYRAIHSPKMRDLRQLLFETRDLQAQFMAKQLETTLSQILSSLEKEERRKVAFLIETLAAKPNGLYVLIDYRNFKGSGLSKKEAYQGQQWGLLQVLRHMASRCPVADFVEASKEILEKRVEKAPPEKNESRWICGWFRRLDTYLEP